MIKGIFFDLDGTLFDTQWDLLDVFTRIFTDAGIPFDPANLKIGPPLTEYMKMLECTINGIMETALRDGSFNAEMNYKENIKYINLVESLLR